MSTPATPGPWGFEGTETHGYAIVTGRPEAPIADLVRGGANARLIAGAPDLLEALKVCQVRVFMAEGYSLAYQQAEDALTRALGHPFPRGEAE